MAINSRLWKRIVFGVLLKDKKPDSPFLSSVFSIFVVVIRINEIVEALELHYCFHMVVQNLKSF